MMPSQNTEIIKDLFSIDNVSNIHKRIQTDLQSHNDVIISDIPRKYRLDDDEITICDRYIGEGMLKQSLLITRRVNFIKIDYNEICLKLNEFPQFEVTIIQINSNATLKITDSDFDNSDFITIEFSVYGHDPELMLKIIISYPESNTSIPNEVEASVREQRTGTNYDFAFVRNHLDYLLADIQDIEHLDSTEYLREIIEKIKNLDKKAFTSPTITGLVMTILGELRSLYANKPDIMDAICCGSIAKILLVAGYALDKHGEQRHIPAVTSLMQEILSKLLAKESECSSNLRDLSFAYAACMALKQDTPPVIRQSLKDVIIQRNPNTVITGHSVNFMARLLLIAADPLLVEFQQQFGSLLNKFCPFCGGDVFVSVGKREKVKCTCCGSLDRQRIFVNVWNTFLSKKFELRHKTVMGVGLAPVEAEFFNNAGATLITVDARPEVKASITGDICSLEAVKDASCDFIFMSCVLDVTHNYFLALKEIKRVLTPNGVFINIEGFVREGPTQYYPTPDTSWYGQEAYDKYKVALHSRFGTVNLISDMSRFFSVETYHGRDHVTGNTLPVFVCYADDTGKHC